jgi:hypothetical protein
VKDLMRAGQKRERESKPKPNGAAWPWRMQPQDLPDDDAGLPRQARLGGVAPLLPCVVMPTPQQIKRHAIAGGGGQVPEVRGFAMVDTGIRMSAIAVEVMNELGIEPEGHKTMFGITSPHPTSAPLFGASLTFPNADIPDLILRDFLGLNLFCEIPGKNVIAILGRAALSGFVMVYDGGPQPTITLIRRP